jgi:hypothetical protein
MPLKLTNGHQFKSKLAFFFLAFLRPVKKHPSFHGSAAKASFTQSMFSLFFLMLPPIDEGEKKLGISGQHGAEL